MTQVMGDTGWTAFGSAGALNAAVASGTFAGNNSNTGPAITVAHGLGTTPTWVGITCQGGFFGWQRLPADGTNLFLQFESPLFVFANGTNYGYRCLSVG